MPETNIFGDISSGSLPAVSWVIPEDQNSDHIGDGDVDDGPSWVASVVNAVGQSSYWNSTAIVIVWDDWGGLYDNAAPPCLSKAQCRDDQGGLGLRVPMIVVSPYAKLGQSSEGGYISSTAIRVRQPAKIHRAQFRLPWARWERLTSGRPASRLFQLQPEAALSLREIPSRTTRTSSSLTARRVHTATPSNARSLSDPRARRRGRLDRRPRRRT